MSLEFYLDRFRSCVKNFYDNRIRRNTSYTYTTQEIGMAAYLVFHMQFTFLSHQENMKKRKGRHNGKTLFGFDNIPSDNHINPSSGLEWFFLLTKSPPLRA